MRLFFAVKVPPEIAAQLAEAQRDLKGNWRRVAPDQLHVTLAFLPDVSESAVDAVRAAGRAAAKAAPRFTARLRGTGYFPNEGSPRVWFVKVDAPELDLIAQSLREHLTVPLDDKPFKAHVTLARKKGPAPRVAPRSWDVSWDVKSFSLIKSTLRKTGPIYETVATFRLFPPAQDGLQPDPDAEHRQQPGEDAPTP